MVEAEQAEGSMRVGTTHAQLSDVVIRELRKGILDGTFKPGERLVEGKLAERLGVSRIPVREALRGLASEGLVAVRPRHGAMVAILSPALAREMIEVRAALEGLNARLAAQHRTQALLDEIEKVLAEGQRRVAASEGGDLSSLNARFHDLLYTAGNNTILEDMMRSLRDRTSVLFVKLSRDDIRATWEEHAGILRAIAAGDAPLAALLAERHVTNAGANYLAIASDNQNRGA
jgi:DNA-binding GntR family transcriptional regulator